MLSGETKSFITNHKLSFGRWHWHVDRLYPIRSNDFINPAAAHSLWLPDSAKLKSTELCSKVSNPGEVSFHIPLCKHVLVLVIISSMVISKFQKMYCFASVLPIFTGGNIVYYSLFLFIIKVTSIWIFLYIYIQVGVTFLVVLQAVTSMQLRDHTWVTVQHC